MVHWSNLPEELLLMIAVRLFSLVELRFRSICTSWRSSVSVTDGNPFPSRPLIQLNPLLVTHVITREGEQQIFGPHGDLILSRASFVRVSSSSSSSSSKGWLIKYEEDELNYGKFPLLNPLSRFRYDHSSWGSIDLFECRVSEIQAAYIVKDQVTKQEDFGFKRLVLDGNNRLLGVGCDGKIRYWNGEIWTRVKDQIAQFCDIVVHRGLTYALDSKGIVWWICSSLRIYRYGPSLDGNATNGCFRELSLVECCGELYIVARLFQHKRQRCNSIELGPGYSYQIQDDVGNTSWKFPEGSDALPITVGFKVYKMDEESVKWLQVKSLGKNAFVVATDTCFSVLAHEFYGCVPNSIYFSDNEKYEIKVFNLDDASITIMSEYSEGCFQMFAPPILH